MAAILAGQLKPLDVAEAQARKRGQADLASLSKTNLATINALAAGIEPAKQTYDSAIAQQQSLAANAAAMLAAANPNAANQEDLRAIGAPPEQQAQLARSAQAQFPGQAAVLNVQAGSIPGSSLLAEREAHMNLLAGLPSIANLASEETQRALLRQQQQTADQAQVDRLRITGQVPSLYTQLQQQNLENQRAAQQARFQQQQAQADAAYRQQELQWRAREAQLDRAAQSATTPYERAQIQLEKQRIADARVAAQPTALDQYKAKTDRLNARSDRRNAVTGGGLTPYQTYEVDQNRAKAFEQTRAKVHQALGLEAAPGAGSIFGGGASTFNVPKNQRVQAYNRLYALYSAPLLRAGVDRASIKALLDTSLNLAGYARPPRRRKPK